MYVKFMLLADSAHTDQDGKLHVNGIFTNINSRTFPCAHQKMTLVARIEGSAKERLLFTPEFQLRDNKGNVLIQQPLPRAKLSPTLSYNLFIELSDVPFKVPGLYEFVLLIDKKFMDSYAFNVTKIKTVKGRAQA